MVKKISHKQLADLIGLYYNQKDETGRKIPLSVVGNFGVGKSDIVREKAREIAHQQGKTFVEWNKITRKQKDTIFSDPSKFFILIDLRLSECDSSDIKGLPDFKDGTCVEWKIPFWAKVLKHPDSDGILFFDEISLAPSLVISSCYKVIHDRVVNESKINDNWLIMAAGNKDEDRAYTHDLAQPLRDRMGEVELQSPGPDSWTEWAIKHGINSDIIAYINWKPSSLRLVDYESEQKQTTARGWQRLNTLIKDIPAADLKTLELVAGSAIGEGIAKEFVGFVKLKNNINLDMLIKSPKMLKDIQDIGLKYFIVSALAEKYKENKLTFERIFKISEALETSPEFIALFWKLCSKYNKKQFKEDWLSKELDHPLRNKFYKYLKED